MEKRLESGDFSPRPTKTTSTGELPDSPYFYKTMRPNPEDPISQVTFDNLDTLISDVNDSVEISNGKRSIQDSRYYANSEGVNDDQPAISLRRYEYNGMSKTLEIDFIFHGLTTHIQLSNDAGTESNRHQIAANSRTLTAHQIIVDRSDNLAESDVLPVIEVVKKQADLHGLVKKYRMPQYLGRQSLNSINCYPNFAPEL
ncbi:MAG: hypothetical protein ACREF5_02745 [Candidatus Saccharimonadales bacterium]